MASRPRARTSPARKEPCSERRLAGKKYYLNGLWKGGGDFLRCVGANQRRPGREGFFALVDRVGVGRFAELARKKCWSRQKSLWRVSQQASPAPRAQVPPLKVYEQSEYFIGGLGGTKSPQMSEEVNV